MTTLLVFALQMESGFITTECPRQVTHSTRDLLALEVASRVTYVPLAAKTADSCTVDRQERANLIQGLSYFFRLHILKSYSK